MNWIAHLDTMATILVSADVASFCVSSVLFSERIRRWTYRVPRGPLLAVPHIDSIALDGTDDLPDESMRLQPITLLRNPFEARSREAAAGGAALRAHRDESRRPTFRRSTVLQHRTAEYESARRPTFRRSTVLQQRIAEYESALADLAVAPPERQKERRPAMLPTRDRLLNPCFERFTTGHLQQARLS
jgi:hypothetical protein